jgi:hypothetical protein
MRASNCTWASLKAALGGVINLVLKEQGIQNSDAITELVFEDFLHVYKVQSLCDYAECTSDEDIDIILLKEVAERISPSYEVGSYGEELRETAGSILKDLCKNSIKQFES